MTDEELAELEDYLADLEAQKDLAIRGNWNYVVTFSSGAPHRGLDARPIDQVVRELPHSMGCILTGVPGLNGFGAVYGDGSKVVAISYLLEKAEDVDTDEDEEDEDGEKPEVEKNSASHPMLS